MSKKDERAEAILQRMAEIINEGFVDKGPRVTPSDCEELVTIVSDSADGKTRPEEAKARIGKIHRRIMGATFH
jgi:hypothetical protein